jgi:hypothetical protein
LTFTKVSLCTFVCLFFSAKHFGHHLRIAYHGMMIECLRLLYTLALGTAKAIERPPAVRWLGACLESFCWRASSHLICYAHAHLMQQAAPDFLLPLAIFHNSSMHPVRANLRVASILDEGLALK